VSSCRHSLASPSRLSYGAGAHGDESQNAIWAAPIATRTSVLTPNDGRHRTIPSFGTATLGTSKIPDGEASKATPNLTCPQNTKYLGKKANFGLARLLVLIGRCEICLCSCLLTGIHKWPIPTMLLRFVFIFIGLLATSSFTSAAAAQVVIPYGDYDSDFEKYLVAAVSLAALVFAVWRYWGSRR
jgi:uncharacterized membrane protein YphA (DoxX/SURF4 family)